MNLLTKSLIALFTTTLLTQSLYAKTTICYKLNWDKPSTIETEKLDGGECKSDYSFKDMKKNGWYLKDLKIEKSKNQGLNYTYIFTDKKLISLDKIDFMKNKYAKLNYSSQKASVKKIDEDTVVVKIGNLRPGQSAVIQHTYKNGQSLIVASAYIVDSNNDSSTLKLMPFLDIKQNAIPTTNRKVVDGDTAIINFLYNASIIIAPSQDAFTQTRKNMQI